LEYGLGGAELGAVTGADPLGSDSGDRRPSGQLCSGGFSIFSFKHFFIDRASVWRMTYKLELLNRLKSVAVCHVHQDLLDASDLDEVIELFLNMYGSRIRLFGKLSKQFDSTEDTD